MATEASGETTDDLLTPEAKGLTDAETRPAPKPFDDYRIGRDGTVWSKKGGEWSTVEGWRVPGGYKQLSLHDGDHSERFVRPRLVGRAFCDPPDNPEEWEIHHLNAKPQDDRAENLVWITPEEHGRLHARRYHWATRQKVLF